jgi:ribose-phosphate pyrophosphokinase
MGEALKVFSGSANRPLAEAICRYLEIPLGKITLYRFPDGEIGCKIDEDVRGRDVFLVQPTSPPVNENIMELLTMMDSFRRASAQRITAVIPYYGYARQDRKDEGRVPITAKLVANIITTAGAHRVLCLDLHAPQVQGFFDVPVDHLYAAPELEKAVRKELPAGAGSELVVVSPDEGRIKLALKYQRQFPGASLAIIDKRRSSATETVQANIIGGPVAGRTALIVDDMLSTGGSIVGAAQVLADNGVKQVWVCITHGLFAGDAVAKLKNAPIDRIFVTDTVPPPELAKKELGLHVQSVAPLIGEAIKRIHLNQSVSYLFNGRQSER